ncbi:MAG: alpha/beta hydrolase [Deltaproteobacteria bacterium]|nr:alpha/beta hydrolase [Deltaproteobacteria bacterium]
MEPKWTHGFAETNGIRMHYVEQGQGFPILFMHGFPELWYSWRNQIPALADAGFRAIAPDLRGYGETDKPVGIELYDIHHLIGDMTGLLDALGEKKAVIVGHDWGGVIVWQMALMAPERVEKVISLNTPFQGRSEIKPTDAYKKMGDGRFNYVLHFQEPGLAESEIEPNVDKWLRSTMRRIAKDQSFITDDMIKIYADAYKKGGMTGPINYYRNADRNWETTAHLAGKKVTMPALMVGAENDPILLPRLMDGMERHIPNLTKRLIKDCGHWTQMERPDEVNRILIEYLSDLKK